MATNSFFRLLQKNVLKTYRRGQIRVTVPARNFSSNGQSFAVMHSEFGDPTKVLYSKQDALPDKLGDSEVLVKWMMAPINPSDINMIEGTYMIRNQLPAVVGNEGVGEVLDVGTSVGSVKPGDWVIPNGTGIGTWATHRVVPQERLMKIDNDIPKLNAATLMVNPPTAYRMLTDFVCLHEGDFVIQNGANSAVGQAVIQLAHEWKYKTINIVRDRPDMDSLVASLKSLGADYVVTEEFCRKPEMKDLIKSLPAPPRLAFNTVGGASATELIRHLGDKGVMVTYGGMSKKPVTVPTGALIFKRVKLAGFWNAKWLQENSDNPERVKMFDELCSLIRDCKFLPPISDMVPIQNYQEAVNAALKGFRGKKTIFMMEES